MWLTQWRHCSCTFPNIQNKQSWLSSHTLINAGHGCTFIKTKWGQLTPLEDTPFWRKWEYEELANFSLDYVNIGELTLSDPVYFGAQLGAERASHPQQRWILESELTVVKSITLSILASKYTIYKTYYFCHWWAIMPHCSHMWKLMGQMLAARFTEVRNERFYFIFYSREDRGILLCTNPSSKHLSGEKMHNLLDRYVHIHDL